MKSEEFLARVRQTEGLSRAVLKKIVVEGRQVVFHLITDASYTQGDLDHACAVARDFVPKGYTARVEAFKSVPSEEGVRAAIAEILKNKFPAAASFVTPAEIRVTVGGAGGRFLIPVGEGERSRFAASEALDCLSRELGRRFCGVFTGEFITVEREEKELGQTELPPEEVLLAPRTFPVTGYAPIDGGKPTVAVYIADLSGEQHGVTVCGTVLHIEERLTRNEKPYFSLTLSDGSGSLRLSYFTRKATLEKVRTVKEGDGICVTGDYELYNGYFSFRAKTIDFGAPPEGFTPEPRPSRAVPAKYVCVFPEPASDLVQSDLFGGRPLPRAVTERDFVVFDLETTGLASTPVGGVMDRIIEIGAVKVLGGQITEKFSSFVACPVRLSEDIVRLTGITDEMLVGAPDVGDVLADFYKFCDGCELVGHNVQFDISFVRFYGEGVGFRFDHKTYDTISFAQEMLRLPSYKLNTIAEHFGFSFNHHRAYDDAFVTAKIFLELSRRKGGLPRT